MNKFLFILLVTFGGFMTGCSDSEEKEAPIEERISLVSSKPIVVANNIDKVEFTVKDKSGSDITTSCIFSANGEELIDNTFKTNKSGKYKITARYNDIESNEVIVTALDENAKLAIKADKKGLIADGGDLINLQLFDEDGNVIVEGVEFFANDEKIEGNCFKTTKTGSYKITAKWNNIETTNSIIVGATAESDFVGRMLVESYTATTCQYCYQVLNVLHPIVPKERRMVLVTIHDVTSQVEQDARAKEISNAIVNYYKISGEPKVYLDRNKTNVEVGRLTEADVLARIKVNSDIAIAIENKYDATSDEIQVSAKIASKKSFTGKVCAVLIENGIRGNQVELGNIELKRLMRDYQPNVEGEVIQVTKGELTNFKATFKRGLAKVENCEVVIFVINENNLTENAQHTPVGINIGY